MEPLRIADHISYPDHGSGILVLYPRALLHAIVGPSIHRSVIVYTRRMGYSSAFQFDDHKDIPRSKQPIIHHCKITSPDFLNMIFQKCVPGLS